MNKSTLLLFSFILLGTFTLNHTSANACSAFMLKGKDYCMIGFNENWRTMPAMVVVNPRGITKQNLSGNQ